MYKEAYLNCREKLPTMVPQWIEKSQYFIHIPLLFPINQQTFTILVPIWFRNIFYKSKLFIVVPMNLSFSSIHEYSIGVLL